MDSFVWCGNIEKQQFLNYQVLESRGLNNIHRQVEQDDIWNALEEHNLMEHVPPDSAIYSYTKEKMTEFISKVLETRNNSQGYAMPI